MRLTRSVVSLASLLALSAPVAARGAARDARISARPLASNIVVPQRRAFAVDARRAVQITSVDVGVVIVEQVATTTMETTLSNSGGARQEAEMVVPVPEGAVVRGFTFQGAAGELSAEVLTKEEARRIYEAIVSKMRDPALLEFAGYNLVRSSVFPVEPGRTQKVRLVYENLLQADGSRVDYLLPRSEALDYRVPWHVSVRIKAARPISGVYSPSHELVTKRLPRNTVLVRVADAATREPGAFRLSYLLRDNGPTASLFAYPAPKEDAGYFLLLASVPPKSRLLKDAPAIQREVTLVLDRSGSMSGAKLHQVREAAKQVLGALGPDEAFNIIVYNESVSMFADRPVPKTPVNEVAAIIFLERVRARGGTNIHAALRAALRQAPREGTLPMVLFLTDGLPTVGETSEVAIRNVAMEHNPHKRRIFTFGVGVDVNTPLLDRIASETRATSTYVLPKEDVEVKVAQVFERLAGPMLADAALEIVGPNGEPTPRRVSDVIPGELPDLYSGDQLVVLGRYRESEPLTFRLGGNYQGEQKTFRFAFDLKKATTENAFVPRLWASRKIALLTDAIRQLGANGSPSTIVPTEETDPRVKELVDEIVRLSVEFGILTEYTAFLAREGTDLARRGDVLAQAFDNYKRRAIDTRFGLGAVNQSLNNEFQRNQLVLNRTNRFFDENLNVVAFANVQQVNDRAFYRRGDRWVDSRLVTKEGTVQPRTVIEFGSAEFRELALKLAQQGRQGCISLAGDILLVVDGEPVLVKGPEVAAAAAEAQTQQQQRAK